MQRGFLAWNCFPFYCRLNGTRFMLFDPRVTKPTYIPLVVFGIKPNGGRATSPCYSSCEERRPMLLNVGVMRASMIGREPVGESREFVVANGRFKLASRAYLPG